MKKKIQWNKILIISFVLSLIFHLGIISGTLNKLIGAHGIYAGFVVAGFLLFLYPLIIICSAAIVSLWVKENRLRHFFITFLISAIINLLMFGLLLQSSRASNTTAMQKAYEDNPQFRPILDPQRPLSIIEPMVLKEKITSPIKVVVYAMPNVLESGKSKVEIKKDVYPKNARIWGEGILSSNGELAKNGQIIYTATASFTPDNNWSEGLITVTGTKGEFDFSRIRP